MKQTIIVICVIAALTLGLCGYTTFTLNEAVYELQQLTEQLQMSADAGDMESCNAVSQAMWDDWQARFSRLASLIPHEDLDKVSLAITGIWQKARHSDTAGISADIGILGEHLDHLLHKEEFRWENLL